MELRFVKASPCRNTTVLIFDEVPQTAHAAVAALAMDAEYLSAEQVGFVSSPRRGDALFHLAMSGGEFCGNAMLALGAWAVREGLAGEDEEFLLTCSGREKPLRYTVQRPAQGRFDVRGEMPEALAVQPYDVEADGQSFSGVLVTFPGIAHFCFPASALPTPLQYDLLLAAVAEQSGREAYGVVPYWRHASDAWQIRPYVGVAATGSRVYENACGSGSLALALALRLEGHGAPTRILQPGGVIVADPKAPSISTAVYFPCAGHLWVPDGTI